MSLTPRVSRLRQQSLEAVPTLSTERAELMTAFCRQDLGPVSTAVRRALAFQYLMEHKTVFIGEGELIVGEKGPAPKAAPTFPELCCHSRRTWGSSTRARRSRSPSVMKRDVLTPKRSSPSGRGGRCAT